MGPFSMYTMHCMMHSFINVINPLMLYKITLYTPEKIISTSVNTKHLNQSSEIPLNIADERDGATDPVSCFIFIP